MRYVSTTLSAGNNNVSSLAPKHKVSSFRKSRSRKQKLVATPSGQGGKSRVGGRASGHAHFRFSCCGHSDADPRSCRRAKSGPRRRAGEAEEGLQNAARRAKRIHRALVVLFAAMEPVLNGCALANWNVAMHIDRGKCQVEKASGRERRVPKNPTLSFFFRRAAKQTTPRQGVVQSISGRRIDSYKWTPCYYKRHASGPFRNSTPDGVDLG